MKTVVAAIFALLAGLGTCEKICFPPQSEYRVFTTVSLDDLYMAADYNINKVVLTPANDTLGDVWTLFDIKEGTTYFKGVDGKCFFKKCPTTQLMGPCLPDDAVHLKTIDQHELYSMHSSSGIGWVVGVTKIKDSEFYHRHLSRVTLHGSIIDIALSYECATTVTDPAVFDKDTSGCEETKLHAF
ncbi:hypothetical protein PoB_004636900 [Plakobranchus ocellatus]|uniref:Uncharacterized protein n=1 Tax=Plakobranchus ocellatus TaxID=259542 RepID=A0AAV4BIC0_9GAST|nr:hypothetical protein PoB_004636900 [Plakobranchus ocellatus]